MPPHTINFLGAMINLQIMIFISLEDLAYAPNRAFLLFGLGLGPIWAIRMIFLSTYLRAVKTDGTEPREPRTAVLITEGKHIHGKTL